MRKETDRPIDHFNENAISAEAARDEEVVFSKHYLFIYVIHAYFVIYASRKSIFDGERKSYFSSFLGAVSGVEAKEML